jgi:tRNA (adenine22-N1)-methyltransferase
LKHSLKLSNRLQQIEKMVTSQYSHIWDCCCDHGLLGCALLSRLDVANIPSNIHFVDIVPDLMAELEKKLYRFYADTTWETHCQDVAKLPLAQYDGKHLIIIAGIGGDLMIEFIEAIYHKHKGIDIDFLLCPVHHQFSLRSKLIELDFSLKDEVLVEENKRFYEIMLVSSTNKESKKINLVGDKIWQSESKKQTEIADKYLNKTIKHYQRMQQGFQQGNTKNVQHIIDAYHAVILSVSSA